MKKKDSHDKFMTEKEKNYVAYVLTKNIRQAEKYKNYAIFFDNEGVTGTKKSKEVGENEGKKDIKNENKKNTKEAHDKVNKESVGAESVNKEGMGTENVNKESVGIEGANKENVSKERVGIEGAGIEVANKESVSKDNKNNDKNNNNEKIKEMFKTIGKTYKKSKKIPRIVIDDNKAELSRNMNIKIALEDLYDKVIDKIYNKKDSEIEITEEYFYYFLQLQKFYKLLILIFNNFEDEKLKPLLFYIVKYSVKIKFVDEFEYFVQQSYMKFPIIENIEESYFFKNFYFNVCNLIVGKYLLKCNSFYLPFFVKYLCDENLELVFALEKDLQAWEFLAVFVAKVDDAQKSVIVSLVKDRVLETMENKDVEALQGLRMFLHAIGLDMEDLE
ncbi:hypothetical protein BDAP_000917 [Binucleata daphniae]